MWNVFSSGILFLSILPFYKYTSWTESGSFRKTILPDQSVELWFCKDSLVHGLFFGYSFCYQMLSIVMLTWSIYSTNTAGLSISRSIHGAFQENRGFGKVMKISPRITGNLTERNQIHETYPCPLLNHTKNTEH